MEAGSMPARHEDHRGLRYRPGPHRAAEADFPGIVHTTTLGAMLKSKDIDNIVVILPHNLHYPAAMECLGAGKGVVLEKPMCLTTEQATDMIELAKKKGLLLTVFHNRRQDGDYKAVKEFIDKGMIGDVFRIEAFQGGYGHPGKWWRTEKAISGGNFYDWGAHQVDWVLNFLAGHKIKNVTGSTTRGSGWMLPTRTRPRPSSGLTMML